MKQTSRICLVIFVLTGCSPNVPTKVAQPETPKIAQPEPSKAVQPEPSVAAISQDASPHVKPVSKFEPDATHNFNSAEGVTRLLEKRWSLADIKTFCIPERRLRSGWQNLVAGTPEVWEGQLYEMEQTGFDQISWYGTVRNGKLDEYSLGVSRGKDYWLLEIAGPESVKNPPTVAPDPTKPYFVGHNGPVKQ